VRLYRLEPAGDGDSRLCAFASPITPIYDPYGWVVVPILCIAVLLCSGVVVLMQLDVYSGRAPAGGVVLVMAGSMLLS